MTERYAAAERPKQQWMVSAAGQTGGLRAPPGEDGRRLARFFDQAL